jgi:hypothetical protein
VVRPAHRRAGSLPGVQAGRGLPRQRRVTDVPVLGHPLELRVRLPRYRCVHDGCAREVFAHDSPAGPSRMVDHPMLRAVRATPPRDRQGHRLRGRARARSHWDTVNSIALATGELLLTAGPARLDGFAVIGVDEHKMRDEASWSAIGALVKPERRRSSVAMLGLPDYEQPIPSRPRSLSPHRQRPGPGAKLSSTI